MSWWMVPFVVAVFVSSAYGLALWVLALVDMASYADTVWRASGHSKTAWVGAFFVLPILSGAACWSRVRPALDVRAPADLRRPVPLIARRLNWEIRPGEWDEDMRRKSWFPWAVGFVVALGIASFVGLSFLG